MKEDQQQDQIAVICTLTGKSGYGEEITPQKDILNLINRYQVLSSCFNRGCFG